MGKWTNSNIRSAVSVGPFSLQIYQRCILDPENKIPYWFSMNPNGVSNERYLNEIKFHERLS